MKKRWILMFLLLAGVAFGVVVRMKSGAKGKDQKPAGPREVAVITGKVEYNDQGKGMIAASDTHSSSHSRRLLESAMNIVT